MKNKIGIGYITCNSPNRVEKTFSTIPKDVGTIVVVNSGCILPDDSFIGADEIIQSGKRISVSVAKNRALRYLMKEKCDHIFLIEDDIIVKDSAVFDEYIRAAEGSGIWHLNYALQGGLNRAQANNTEIKTMADINKLNYASEPAPRSKLKYRNGSKLAFYTHTIGAFQYFYKGIIKNVGYFDERYTNAFENVDYTYRVIQKGLHPPFWWFADIDNASDYLESLDDCMTESVLRNDAEYGKNLLFGKQWFKGKFDCSPELISDVSENTVLKKLNNIEFNYSRSNK